MSRRRVLVACLAFLLAACGGERSLPVAPRPDAVVARIEVVSGSGQRMWSGRRSSLPFRVRALDATGSPLAETEIAFAVEGSAGGDLTQPRALTDADGFAETWLLRARAGTGSLVATAGAGRVTLPFTVDQAAAQIRFLPSSRAVGVPGRVHPDSVLTVRVLDGEGRPLPGMEVWFAAIGELRRPVDTTDADGIAGTVLSASGLGAGGNDVYAFMTAFPELLAHDVRPTVAPVKRVVLVSVDGLRADALVRWRPPTLLRLAAEGASAARATTVAPGLTAPAQLSLLSGVGPERHGVWRDVLDVTPQMSSLDPLFRRAARSGRVTVAYVSAEGPLGEFERALACRLAFGLDSLVLTPPEAAAAVDAALPALRDSTANLVFVHLPDPDLAGHRRGWTSADYGIAVGAVDAALARVVSAVAEVPGTLLIVTSDHGGGGAWGPYQHGSGSAEDQEIPLLLWGEGVAPGAFPTGSILDVAPTVLWALGVAPPPSYQGRVLLEAFR